MAGKMPGFLLNCINTIDSTGKISTTSGCVQPSGMPNRIASGFPEALAIPSGTPSAALSPPTQTQTSGTAPAIGAFDPNLKNPSVHEWNLSIQRELPKRFIAEVGYVGKRGKHLYRAYDLNQGKIPSDFLAAFNIARANLFAGCAPSGTGCPAGVTGQSPGVLATMVSSSFLNGTTTQNNLKLADVGNLA